ncbi:hypothetical protein ACWEPN_31100 [Nonomuraea wenchangensis]
MDGRIWFRYGGAGCTLTSAGAARAAALAEAYSVAVARTSHCSPADVFRTEQLLSLELATWRRAKDHPGLRIKGRMALALTHESAKRAAAYEEELRAAHLDQTLTAARLDHLARTALADLRKARLWWFGQHLGHGELLESWDSFDTVVRPLIDDNIEDTATRFAQVIATAVQRALDDPDKAEDIRLMAHVLLTKVGWPDLAAALSAESAVQPSNERPVTRINGKGTPDDKAS